MLNILRSSFSKRHKKSFLRNRQPPNFYKKLSVFILLFIILLTVIFFLVLNLGIFEVRKILIKNDTACANKDQITKELQPLADKIFLINDTKINQKITDSHPCISGVRINKIFPDQIEILLDERKPAAFVKNILLSSSASKNILPEDATPSSQAANIDLDLSSASQSAIFVVDKQGFVLSDQIAQINTLPLILIVGEEVALNKYIPNKIIPNTLVVIDKLKELSIPYNQMTVFNKKIFVDASPKIIFSLDKDLIKQTVSLQLILQKATINSKMVENIDLRFDKPVVVYSPKKK